MARTRQPVQQRPLEHDRQVPDHRHAPGELGNAARQELLRHPPGQVGARPGQAPAPRARLTPAQRFQEEYLRQKNRPLDADRQELARWRELSAEEVSALGGQDPRQAPQPGERGYTTTVNGRTFRYDRVQEDPANPTLTADLMGGQAEQFFSRAFVTERPRQNPNDRNERVYQDVTVLGSDGRVNTLSQNDQGMVELPASGFGYSTYNRNDVRLPNGRAQQDQWGKPQAVAGLINLAADYRTLLPNRTVEYGDIATQDNQSPLLDTGRTARHATHGEGDQVDLRYPDTMFETNALIRSAENWGVNNFYYDPDMQGEAFFGQGSRATPERHHRDHLHMGWGRGGR